MMVMRPFSHVRGALIAAAGEVEPGDLRGAGYLKLSMPLGETLI